MPAPKAGHWTVYPLTNVVGTAILDYVQHGRPQTEDRHLCFRTPAPRLPLRASAISQSAGFYLRKAGIIWISWARRCRLAPFKTLGKTFRDHLEGIVNAYELGISNAASESINSQVQAAIVRARGYRNLSNLLNMIYLTVGQLTHLPAPPFAPAKA